MPIEPAQIDLSPIAYNVPAFCRAIGIGKSKLYEMLQQGEIKSVMVGGRRLIPASEARRLISEAA